MKFALIGPVYPLRGGIAQYTTALFKALERRYDVLLLSFSRQYPQCLFPGSTQADQSRQPFQVPGEQLLDSLNPASWKKAAERLLQCQPDVLIFQWWQPFLGLAYADIVGRVKKGTDASVFFLCHNVYSHERPRFPGAAFGERFLIKRAFTKVDGFLIHSQTLLRQVRAFNLYAPVRRIYHPVYDFYANWDTVRLERNTTPQLLFFGNVRRYKGLGILLKALDILKRRMNFKAVIAGEFYVNPEPYRQMARELGLCDRLVWFDRYISNEEVPGLFRQADLVVLPYLEATQSGVVPLAFHFDVPVVASDVGGLSEVVMEGKTGYLVPAGEPEILAERIVQYFQENKKQEFQGHIQDFKRNLSWTQAVDGIVDLLDQVKHLQSEMR